MTSDPSQNATQDPGFFTGRVLIRIRTWDWRLSVSLRSEAAPPEEGGLQYIRDFEIEGEIAAPKTHRGKAVRVWLSPFDKDLRFGPENYPEVGRFYFRHPDTGRDGLSLRILLPQDSISTTATCLASVWKLIHVWTVDPDAEQASIRSYSFSAATHPNLESWVDGD